MEGARFCLQLRRDFHVSSASELNMLSTCANADDFASAHWRVIASGFDTERWFNDGQAVGTGGILSPRQTQLPAGHYYYRFADSSQPWPTQIGSGWWLDFENFALVRSFARDNGYRLQDAARLMLAVPYNVKAGGAMKHMDRLLHAYLKRPLLAWTGYGKPFQAPDGGADRGTRWVPTQHIKVRQLYIPGLYVDGRDPQLSEMVFAKPVEILGVD